jgi:urea transport system ATP-binding protein
MLEVNNAYVNYGQGEIVQNISFCVHPGEKLVLLGRNGVGKTTTLKGMIGLLPLSSGEILLDGKNVAKKKPHVRVSSGLAYVPQGREIIPDFTVRENLELGMKGLPKEKRGNTLDYQINWVLEYFPALYEHMNRKGGVLSGGQQQQLAIARALMASPQYLMLDEPTEGIQPNIVEEMVHILHRIAKDMNVAVILVEQNINFAKKFADNYMIMHKGSIVDRGNMQEISDTVIKKYLSV